MQTKLILSMACGAALLAACAQPGAEVATSHPCLGIAPQTGSMIVRKEYCERVRAEAKAARGQADVAAAGAPDKPATKIQ